MNFKQALRKRSNDSCELCTSTEELDIYPVTNTPEYISDIDSHVHLCKTCLKQLGQTHDNQNNHWHCLNNAIWSQVPAIQIIAWRQLRLLSTENWAQDLLEMLYLDDETLAWAKANETESDNRPPTLDSNGTQLKIGDTVTLIKDLTVKGAGFTAKRGTAVRNISLTNNHNQIEGRVNGQRIVLLSQYLKRTS